MKTKAARGVAGILLPVGAGLVILITGCSNDTAPTVNRADEPAVAAVAAKMHVVLPANAVIVGIRDTRGLDGAAFMKVRFESGQWERFLRASPLKGEEFSDGRRYLLGPDDGWWNPERPKALPAAQTRLPEGKVLNMGVDRDDPATVTVYLMRHET